MREEHRKKIDTQKVGLGGGGGSMRDRRFAAIPSSRASRYMQWQRCYIQHRVYAQSLE